MNTANIIAAIQIAMALSERAADILAQVKAAHETGEGITDEQLAVIRSGVDASRENLVAAINAVDPEPEGETVDD